MLHSSCEGTPGETVNVARKSTYPPMRNKNVIPHPSAKRVASSISDPRQQDRSSGTDRGDPNFHENASLAVAAEPERHGEHE